MIIDANIKLENVQIIQNCTEDLEITTIQNDIVQILLNIINNAVDVLKNKKDDKLIFIDIYRKKDFVYISLLDSAGGIAEDIIDKIFEPYFTTKDKRVGTGVDLYISKQIIKDRFNGDLKVINKSFDCNGKSYFGANFIITIPENQMV
jgi:signal transduction histidine kinase